MTDAELANELRERARIFRSDASRLSDDARRMTKMAESYDQQELQKQARLLRIKVSALLTAAEELSPSHPADGSAT